MAERALQFQKTSSTISGAVYDPDEQKLTISFKSGHSGFYSGVAEDDAMAFERSNSPGQHHDIYFKKAGVSYTKIS